MERRLKNERNGRVVLKNEQQRTQKKTVPTSIIGQPPDFVRRCRRLVIPREPSCLCFFFATFETSRRFRGLFRGDFCCSRVESRCHLDYPLDCVPRFFRSGGESTSSPGPLYNPLEYPLEYPLDSFEGSFRSDLESTQSPEPYSEELFDLAWIIPGNLP